MTASNPLRQSAAPAASKKRRRFVGFRKLAQGLWDGAFRKDRSHVTELSGLALHWPNDETFLQTSRRVQGIRGIPLVRCYGLQSAIRSVADVEGDVAECGVRYGRSTLFMLDADRRKRDYFLFDSWEGLSEPQDADQPQFASVQAWERGDIASEEAEARNNLKDFPNVQFLRGWIPDRFAEVSDRRFALVHLDVDLYEPTRQSLDFFAERMAKGGVIVCDDYGSLRCPGARQACDEFVARRGARLFESASGQCLIFDLG